MTSYDLVIGGDLSPRLSRAIYEIQNEIGLPRRRISGPNEIGDLRGRKLLFVLQLDRAGFCPSLGQIFDRLAAAGSRSLSGCTGAVIVSSPNEFFTKSAAQQLIFSANLIGCRFIGHPLVEAAGDLENLRKWQKTISLSLEDIFMERCLQEAKSLIEDQPVLLAEPRILALHASSRKTSNTVTLWDMVREHLDPAWVEEINVNQGVIQDCRGCTFRECSHFSQQDSCFYGGVVSSQILPAIEKADGVVWICPNYNDAISANLMAVINRMTALYRKSNFYRKTMFAIIVSGNSGSDSVARQLIGALNINKGFRLPPDFALHAIANDPGEIKNVSDIREKARRFAAHLQAEIKA